MKRLICSKPNYTNPLDRQRQRFVNCPSGGVAVEFAFILPLFLFLLLVVIETGYIALTNIVIDGAVSTASREIRTGVVQQSANPLGRFRSTLCNEVNLVVNCDLVRIDVQNFTTFPDPTGIAPPGAGNTFNPGTADQITLVRVTHTWNYVTPFLQTLIGPGGRQHIASAIFRVEPFLQN